MHELVVQCGRSFYGSGGVYEPAHGQSWLDTVVLADGGSRFIDDGVSDMSKIVRHIARERSKMLVIGVA